MIRSHSGYKWDNPYQEQVHKINTKLNLENYFFVMMKYYLDPSSISFKTLMNAKRAKQISITDIRKLDYSINDINMIFREISFSMHQDLYKHFPMYSERRKSETMEMISRISEKLYQSVLQ